MEQKLKDILDQSMTAHGWPDKTLTDDEVFSLEFGDIAVAPKPAIRKSVPIMSASLARMVNEALTKAIKT